MTYDPRTPKPKSRNRQCPLNPVMCEDPSLTVFSICVFLDLTLGSGIYWFVFHSFQKINFQEDWKVITLFIGGNDLCDFCNDPVGPRPLTQRLPPTPIPRDEFPSQVPGAVPLGWDLGFEVWHGSNLGITPRPRGHLLRDKISTGRAAPPMR